MVVPPITSAPVPPNATPPLTCAPEARFSAPAYRRATHQPARRDIRNPSAEHGDIGCRCSEHIEQPAAFDEDVISIAARLDDAHAEYHRVVLQAKHVVDALGGHCNCTRDATVRDDL